MKSDIPAMETIRTKPQRASTKVTVSVALGFVAAGCALASVVTTTVWLCGLAVGVALLGFLLGYSADQQRGAILGELLNFATLALLVVWGFVVVAQAML